MWAGGGWVKKAMYTIRSPRITNSVRESFICYFYIFSFDLKISGKDGKP